MLNHEIFNAIYNFVLERGRRNDRTGQIEYLTIDGHSVIHIYDTPTLREISSPLAKGEFSVYMSLRYDCPYRVRSNMTNLNIPNALISIYNLLPHA